MATTSTSVYATPSKPAVRRSRWRRNVKPWLYLAPLLLLNFIVVIVPSILAVSYAFTDWTGLGAAKASAH